MSHSHKASVRLGLVRPTVKLGQSSTKRLGASVPAKPSPVQAAATSANTLYFQGGQNIGGQAAQAVVEGPPKVYVVFYGNQWGNQAVNANGDITLSKDVDGAAPVAQELFKGLGTGGESWSGTMTQYCDGPTVVQNATACPAGAPHTGYPTGGSFAGAWYDNSVAEPQQATQAQLGSEALSAAKHFGNTTEAANRNVQYMILSAPGTDPDTYLEQQQFCAWHSNAWSSDSSYTVAFTNQPYTMDWNNHCGNNFLTQGSAGVLDGYTMTLGHEYAETVSDAYSGWFTPAASDGGENGDHCAWISTGQGAAAYVQTGHGSFAMQSTWSNDTNECDISHVVIGGQGGAKNTVTVTNPGNQSGTVGTASSVQIRAIDSAAGTTLGYAASGLPAGLSINAGTGLISGTPTGAATSTVTVRVTDNTGVSGSTTFAFAVVNAPTVKNTVTVTDPGFQFNFTGYSVSLQIQAHDTAASKLTYSAKGLPAGLSINSNTGLITGSPTAGEDVYVTVNVSDATGASGSDTFEWYVWDVTGFQTFSSPSSSGSSSNGVSYSFTTRQYWYSSAQ